MKKKEKQRYFKNRKEWRSWLEKNHVKEDVLWLVYYKKHTSKTSVSYDEAVEEALCFGWIDGKVQRIDDEKYKQRYTPRRKNSIWSVTNIKRVEKMTELGMMTEAGWGKVKEARNNGEWEKAILSEDVTKLPDGLKDALSQNRLMKKFENLKFSHKKYFIWWVRDAKRENTRERRIKEVVRMINEGKMPGGM